MAIEYLTPNDQASGISGKPTYDYTATLSAGAAGNTIMLPDGAGNIESWMVGLIISSGNGRVEYTNSTRAAVVAGSADWRPWDAGDVTANEDDVFYPVTAVRAYRNSGTIKFEVVVS